VPFEPPPFTLRTRRDGAASVVAVTGELDASTVQEFVWAIDGALEERPAVLCIDLTAVAFADSSALAAIVRTRRITSWRGTALTVAAGDGPAGRLFELTGLGTVIDVYPTVDAALSLSGGSLRDAVTRRVRETGSPLPRTR